MRGWIKKLVLAVIAPPLLFWMFGPNVFNRLPPEVDKVLREAESAELLSLVPENRERFSTDPETGKELPSYPHVPPEKNFHNYEILGSTTIRGEDWRGFLAEIDRGLADKPYSLVRTRCYFEPRQGIRVLCDGHSYDVAVCFHCKQVAVYRDQEKLDFLYMGSGKPDTARALLGRAGVPLAKAPTQ
jgi:hypothetical protein